MIRDFSLNYLTQVNKLLNQFNYSITKESFDNDFLKILVFDDEYIKGVLVYEFLYDRIEIDYIVVCEECRREGIATKLLNYMEKQYKNINNITLEVRSSNISAIEFYLKNGFTKATIRKNYYGTEDGILMIKKMGD